MVRTVNEHEEGQVYLVLLMLVAFLIASGGLIARYAGQDSVSAQARTAADAAALAGADIAVEDLLDELLNDTPSFEFGCDVGRSAAENYAAKNGATLTSYCFNFATGVARAEVRINRLVSNRAKYQVSSAKLPSMPNCVEEEPGEPAENDDVDESAEPPEPSIRCTLLGLDDDFGPGDELNLDAIARLLEPRLVASN